MGKATKLRESVLIRTLSPAEIRDRQAAAESGGYVEGTPEGELIKRSTSSEAPRVVLRAPEQTWD